MKQFSDTIPVQKSLKQGEAMSPLVFKFALEFSIRKILAKQEGINGMGRINCRSVLITIIY